LSDAAKRFNIRWLLRAPGKATQPPDPNSPNGIDYDVSRDARPACRITLPYPAAGLGMWAIECKLCGFSITCTAAGRADDPRSITMACKRQVTET
jgi:hypothetical protein